MIEKQKEINNIKFALGVSTVLLIVVNMVLLSKADADRSWGAFAIAFFLGPTVNIAFAVISLVFAFWIKRISPDSNAVQYFLVGVLPPVGAIVCDFLIISSMKSHGC